MTLATVEIDAEGRTTVTAVQETPECPFNRDGAHDFDGRVVEGVNGGFLQQNCRRCGLVLPVPTPDEPRERACPRCFGEIYVWADGFISKTDGNGPR